MVDLPESSTPASSKEFELLLNDLYFRLEERDKWADQTIRYLLYGNGGGIALLLAMVGSSTKAGSPMPGWMLLPLLFFLPGVIAIGRLVRHSTQSVRAGRRALRTRMNRFLKSEIGYDKIFNDMSDSSIFPSKWQTFDNMSKWSFRFFLGGVLASAVTYILTSFYYHPAQLHLLQPCQLISSDNRKLFVPPPRVDETKQPANAQNPPAKVGDTSK